jgi:hypothetical protein
LDFPCIPPRPAQPRERVTSRKRDATRRSYGYLSSRTWMQFALCPLSSAQNRSRDQPVKLRSFNGQFSTKTKVRVAVG